jgi:5'-nucleotidase
MTKPRVPVAESTAITRRRVLHGLAAAPALLLPNRVWAQQKTTLTVLHTNDTHSRMMPFESGPYAGQGGVARRATVFRRAREARAATVVLDAGDTFQGTPWFNEFKGELDIQVMHALGYDATALGNHDFDAGAEKLSANLAHAPTMAALAANYAFDVSSPLLKRVEPHVILARGGLKVGVFGLGIAFEGLVNPKLHAGVRYTDPRDAARSSVDALRSMGADVVLAVSHLGYSGYRGETGDTDWPKDVPGVTYVVSGHTHTLLQTPAFVRHASGWETAIMQVGHSGLFVGHAEIVVDGRGRAEVTRAAPRAITTRAA